MRKIPLLAYAAVVLALHVVTASDGVGLYALVDKVVLEPNIGTPERIQIWGVFAMAAQLRNGAEYQMPRQGYLYFRVPDYGAVAARPDAGAELARKEWADLLRIAGTRQVVGLGGRYSVNQAPPAARARVRPASEPPREPEMYDLAGGVIQLRSDTDYPPIKSLLEFQR